MITTTYKAKYKPGLFILLSFAVTWICALMGSRVHLILPKPLLFLIDLLASASPLLAALFLLRHQLTHHDYIARLFSERKKSWGNYLVVFGLFIYQFFHFFLFRTPENSNIVFSAFLITWLGQIFLGGGLGEGGWRGYLQLALEREFPVLASTVLVGLIWSFWQLPYFFLSSPFYPSGNFFFHILATILTSFTLTAIYRLTESVLLCTLFYSWQNALSMSLMTPSRSVLFHLLTLILGVISIWLCLYPNINFRKSRFFRRSRRRRYPPHHYRQHLDS